MQKNKVNIALVGFGTVGTGVVKILKERTKLLQERSGLSLCIKKICDKDIRRNRGIKIDKSLLTRNIKQLTQDPHIHILVELIGGIHPAKEIIIEALKNGKDVVTANKALLAEEGKEIFSFAQRYKRQIRFEASVGGGIPIIKSIREGLISNRFYSIFGILNGTTNFILSRMTEKKLSFKEALKEAKKRGFAEKDPSLDIKGIDSAHKLVLLIYLSFGKFINLKDIFVEGITNISWQDIVYAQQMGLRIKLLAIAKREKDSLEARVHPTLISEDHPLAAVSGVFNAIYVVSDLAGEQIFYGQGAGQLPSASAVVSDIVDLAKGRYLEKVSFYKSPYVYKLLPLRKIKTRYYIRFMVIDRPGVLAKISGILGKHNISIASVSQKERRYAKVVPVIMTTHEAKEHSLKKALEKIKKLEVVKKEPVVIRMEKI